MVFCFISMLFVSLFFFVLWLNSARGFPFIINLCSSLGRCFEDVLRRFWFCLVLGVVRKSGAKVS